MSSRLYRAIVGVGISLGTSMGACSGAIEMSQDGNGNGSDIDAAQDGDGSVSSDSAVTGDAGARDAARSGDAGADSAALDAAKDAPKDAILDAFCDATWPTTKGNSGGPTCGPVVACAEAGPAPRCVEELAPSVCNAVSPGSAAWCVGDQWACSTGSVPQASCTCWGPLEAGASCP